LHHSFLTANVAKEKLEVPIFEDTLFSSNVWFNIFIYSYCKVICILYTVNVEISCEIS
jgi:hypothetical protein